MGQRVIEVDTWGHTERGIILTDGDDLVGTAGFGDEADFAVRELLDGEPLASMENIIVLWYPGCETGCVFKLVESVV